MRRYNTSHSLLIVIPTHKARVNINRTDVICAHRDYTELRNLYRLVVSIVSYKNVVVFRLVGLYEVMGAIVASHFQMV